MEIAQFIILILFIIYTIFKEYLITKGKNIATKEDIEEITEKIEHVKLELQHSHSQKSAYIEQNKLSVLNFYDKYIQWLEIDMKNVSLSIDEMVNPEKMTQKIINLKNQHHEVVRAIWRLTLFETSDKIFLEKVKEFYSIGNRIHSITVKYFYNLEYLSVKASANGKIITQEINSLQDEYYREYLEKGEELKTQLLVAPSELSTLITKKLLELHECKPAANRC